MAGGVLEYEVVGEQLLLDDNTLHWIIEEMGTNIQIDVDYENYIIEIINQDVNYDYQLIVEGQDISQEAYVKVYKEQDYVMLPFISVMEALGAEVNWTSETFAEITFKDMKCSYDSDAMEIVDMYSGRPFRFLYNYDNCQSQMIGRELYWNEVSFRLTLECMDVYLKIDVDHENQKITVEYLEDEVDPAEYRLIVQGQELPEGKYVEIHNNYRYELLPFTAIIKALGAEINWTSETMAEIEVNGMSLVFDNKIPVLKAEDGYDRFLFPMQGYRVFFKIMDREVLLDANNLENGALKELGFNVDIHIDYEEKVVEIDHK